MQASSQKVARYELRLMLEGPDGAARDRFEVRVPDDLFALALLPIDRVHDVRAIWSVRAGTLRITPDSPEWLEPLLEDIEQRMMATVRRIPASLIVPTSAVTAFTLLQELHAGWLSPESSTYLQTHAALATPARKVQLKEWAAQLNEAHDFSSRLKQTIQSAESSR